MGKKKKTVTRMEVVTGLQLQSIGYRWQAILSWPLQTIKQIYYRYTLPGGEQVARAQPLTKCKVIGMKGVVSKGEG